MTKELVRGGGSTRQSLDNNWRNCDWTSRHVHAKSRICSLTRHFWRAKSMPSNCNSFSVVQPSRAKGKHVTPGSTCCMSLVAASEPYLRESLLSPSCSYVDAHSLKLPTVFVLYVSLPAPEPPCCRGACPCYAPSGWVRAGLFSAFVSCGQERTPS